MSERYYTCAITPPSAPAIYVTSTGALGGVPCKLDETRDDNFVDDIGETITPAADGTIHSQSVELPVAAGREFEINILFCPATLKESLEDALRATRGTSATVRVQLSSVKRVIDVQAKANGNGWLTTGKFSGSIINDVTIRLISTGSGGGA